MAFSLRGGAKPNPLMRKDNDQREKRRDLFMKKVQSGRADKRWEGRSEQVRYFRPPYLNERDTNIPFIDLTLRLYSRATPMGK
jgi:hypothetical protein